MFRSLTALLSFFLLANICAAYHVGHANSSFFRRDDDEDYSTAPTTTEIFSTGTSGEDGICSAAQIATIDSFLEEVWLLHHAALTAYNEYETDLGYRMLFATYLGVGWQGTGPDAFSAPFLSTAVGMFLSVQPIVEQSC